MRVGLEDQQGSKCGKALEINFSGTMEYGDVVNLCEDKFGCKISGLKVAENTMNDFGSLNLHSILQKNKIYPSRHKIYAVKATDYSSSESEDTYVQTRSELELTSKTTLQTKILKEYM